MAVEGWGGVASAPGAQSGASGGLWWTQSHQKTTAPIASKTCCHSLRNSLQAGAASKSPVFSGEIRPL